MEQINVSEQNDIIKSLLLVLNNFNNIPVEKVEYQYLSPDDTSMSLNSLQGAVKSKQFVNGSYIGLYPFSIVYRVFPTNTNQRIDGTKVIDEIGELLENLDYLSCFNIGNKKVISIERTSTSSLVYRGENGVEDYQGLFRLEFMKEE